jgi:phage FluMu protein Com
MFRRRSKGDKEMGKAIYCRDCGKALYRIAHSSNDKPSLCPRCKSTSKCYLTHGASKEHSSAKHIYSSKEQMRTVTGILDRDDGAFSQAHHFVMG